MEAKECLSDLWDTCVGLLALNVDMVSPFCSHGQI